MNPPRTLSGMLTILRFAGLMNAAVWLGGAVFFSFVAAPGFFQPAMKGLFQNYQDYYAGLIAQMMQERYFAFHFVCGGIALLHALGHWLLRRRESQRVVLGVLAGLWLLSLAGAFVLQPELKSLFQTKHTAPTMKQRETAAASFRTWHGVAQGFNLIVLGGLVFYVWRMAAPSPETRFTTPVSSANPFAGVTYR